MRQKVKKAFIVLLTAIMIVSPVCMGNVSNAAKKKHNHGKPTQVKQDILLSNYYTYKIPKVGIKRFKTKQKGTYAKYYIGRQSKVHRYITYPDGCLYKNMWTKWI